MTHRYLIALGSNQWHVRHGDPRRVLAAAFERLDRKGLKLIAASSVIDSAPHGPSRRRYANAVAVISSKLEPDALLGRLHRIEAKFGRRRRGQRWGARVLDLDLVLWSGGIFAQDQIMVPHPRFRARAFVLGPALAVAADWRDPLTGLTLRHLHARLTRKAPNPPAKP